MEEKDRRSAMPVPLFIRLCADKLAYEIKLQQRIQFDIDKVRKLLEDAGNYRIKIHTPYIVVLETKRGEEITFSNMGRMLIKKVISEEDAKSAAYELLDIAMKASKT